MPQVAKPEMRRAIVQAAAEEFAAAGFAGATLAGIARRAETSVGNLYKYFANKDELFDAALPADLAARLTQLLTIRVEALGAERDVDALTPDHAYHAARDALFAFALAQRAQVLFLLRRAEGTRYADFADALARNLVKLALGYVKRAYPTLKLGASRQRALLRLYRAFLEHLASMLAEERSEAALREANEHFGHYHLAGLRAFFEAAEREQRDGAH